MLAGTAGAVTCVTFIWFSAPDLALTQLTVEVMTTLLLLLGLRWLPAARAESRRLQPAHQADRRPAGGRATSCIAVAAGIGNGGPRLRGDDPRTSRAHLVLPRAGADRRRRDATS